MNTTLTEVNRKMKDGDVTRVANITNYSVSHVSNVLAGRRTNNKIVEAARKLTKRRK